VIIIIKKLSPHKNIRKFGHPFNTANKSSLSIMNFTVINKLDNVSNMTLLQSVQFFAVFLYVGGTADIVWCYFQHAPHPPPNIAKTHF
jgi:hypothetical protein